MSSQVEPELLIIERAFPEAQALLASTPSEILGSLVVGWHDTVLSRWTGAAAVVRRGGPLEERVGEIIRVSTDFGSAVVYVVGTADVERDLSLARRAFLAVCPLAEEEILMSVEAGG